MNAPQSLYSLSSNSTNITTEVHHNDSTTPFIQVTQLSKYYWVNQGWLARKRALQAVHSVSFSVARGSTFGLVGESGSGKSTIAKMLLGAEAASTGQIRIGNQSPQAPNAVAQRAFHRAVQPVLQDPYASLSPLQRIHSIIDEPMRIHGLFSVAESARRVLALLELVGLSPEMAQRYPHELSGGQRQRIAIARALGIEPQALILDEPVSALDVSVQAQILNLLKDLQRERQLTYLMISHDLAVVGYMASHIGVLYLGQLMEVGTRDEIVSNARHPYTQALIASSEARLDAPAVEGEIPSPMQTLQGCPFQARCSHASAICRTTPAPIRALSTTHRIACHHDIAV